MKKNTIFITSILCSLALTACTLNPGGSGSSTEVKSVTVTGAKSAIDIGETLQLTATVNPETATNRDVTWKSNDIRIVTIDQTGLVTGAASGTTTVEAISNANPSIKGTYSISVNNAAILSSITINTAPTKTEYEVGEFFSPDGLVINEVYSDKSTKVVAYLGHEGDFSFNPTLSTSLTKAISNVTITYKGFSATQKITVNDKASTKEWVLVENASDLHAGDAITLAVPSESVTASSTISSTNNSKYFGKITTSVFSNDKKIITSLGVNSVELTLGGSAGAWTLKNNDGQSLGATANKKIAWNSGTTTWSISIADGEATIQNGNSSYGKFMYNKGYSRFSTYSNTSASSSMLLPSIYSGEPEVKVYPTDFTFETPIENKMDVGDQYQLNLTYIGEGVNYKKATFATSDNSIVSVSSSGLLTANKAGSATITIKAKSSDTEYIEKQFTLTIFNVAVQSISFAETEIELVEGRSLTLTPTILPSNATDKSVTWKSSNSSAVSVSDAGVIKGLTADASARITATTNDGNKEAYVDVTVTEAPTVEKTKLLYTYDDYHANNYYTNSDNCPTLGNPKLLIIPVWFTDSSSFIADSKKESVRSDIEIAYLGTEAQTGWHSVKSFYEEESLGRITLSGTVSEWYSCGKSYTYYGTDNNTSKTTSLVTSASDWYFTNHTSENRKDYDTNGDGYLDGVLLIYAAPDSQAASSNYDNLWAYCYWTSSNKNVNSPTANTFFWASYDFMYGNNASSKTGKSSYNSGSSSNGLNIDAHTFIHEMGHVFGAEDYYDYSYKYSPAAGFSMQDNNVGGHDPYSVMAYGWADPYVPTESMTITIGDFQSTHDVILLANHTGVNSPFDEYLLIEYYTPTGLNKFDSDYQYQGAYPQGPSVGGIRLWHVDARLCINQRANFTTNPTVGDVLHAMSNSYSGEGYVSPLGSAYYNYNILQLIRNSTSADYKPTDELSASSLFKAGDSFLMSTFKGQFVNGTSMNDGKALGWSFVIDSIDSNGATITLTKN